MELKVTFTSADTPNDDRLLAAENSLSNFKSSKDDPEKQEFGLKLYNNKKIETSREYN